MKKKSNPKADKIAPLDIDRSIIDFDELFLMPFNKKIKLVKPLAKQIYEWILNACPIQDTKYMGISNLKFIWSLYLKELHDLKEEEGDEENMEFMYKLFIEVKNVFGNRNGRFWEGRLRDGLLQPKKRKRKKK